MLVEKNLTGIHEENTEIESLKKSVSKTTSTNSPLFKHIRLLKEGRKIIERPGKLRMVILWGSIRSDIETEPEKRV